MSQKAVRDDVMTGAPDLVVLIKAVGVLGSTVRYWSSQGAKVINIFPDNPFDVMGIDFFGRMLLPQFRALTRMFVHDRFAVGQLRQLGVPSAFLAFARDPAIHDPDRPFEKLPDAPRIAFVGSPDRERIRYLRAIADLGLGLWGNWDRAWLKRGDPLLDCVRGSEALGHEMVRCLRSADLSVNVLRRSQKTAHNMRTFESPGCRACTLSEATYGVQELFKSHEVVMFSTPEELRQKTLELLSNPRRRDDVAAAGWERVRGETYRARAETVLESL
jgi:hypothetical protein